MTTLPIRAPMLPSLSGFARVISFVTVLVEFDSLDKAIACHDTPAYKEALKALGTGNVERDMRVVEGAA